MSETSFLRAKGGADHLPLDVPKEHFKGYAAVIKFGRTVNVDSGVATDVWDGAAAAVVWVAPTEARIHQIASSSASDDGDPAGVGARTIRIWGLPDWDSAEITEDKILNGTTDVPTDSAYVIIHRMEVLTKGATGVNVGAIAATADTDGTITAQINVGQGRTQMAIYGIPSTQDLYLTRLYASVLRANLTTSEQHVDMDLAYNPEPDAELLNFITRFTGAIATRGSNPFSHEYNPYNKFTGPGILKIRATGSLNDLDVSAGFDGYLITRGAN